MCPHCTWLIQIWSADICLENTGHFVVYKYCKNSLDGNVLYLHTQLTKWLVHLSTWVDICSEYISHHFRQFRMWKLWYDHSQQSIKTTIILIYILKLEKLLCKNNSDKIKIRLIKLRSWGLACGALQDYWSKYPVLNNM